MNRIVACLTLFLATPASALVCADLDDVLARLSEAYGETPVFQGVLADGAVIVTGAPDGGGFTLLLVTPDGDACHIADGEGWAAKLPQQPGKES